MARSQRVRRCNEKGARDDANGDTVVVPDESMVDDEVPNKDDLAASSHEGPPKSWRTFFQTKSILSGFLPGDTGPSMSRSAPPPAMRARASCADWTDAKLWCARCHTLYTLYTLYCLLLYQKAHWASGHKKPARGSRGRAMV